MIPYWYLTTIYLGPIPIHVWGLFVALGFIVALCFLVREARMRGMDVKVIVDLGALLLIAGMIGGRLGHVLFYEPAYYLAHPIDVLKIWEGGLSSFGGFLAAALVGLWFVRRQVFSSPFHREGEGKNIPPPLLASESAAVREGGRGGVCSPTNSATGTLLRYSDILLHALMLGWFIGRLGCYSIHDHPGIVCDGFFCIPFPDGVRRLDMGLMDGLLALAIFIIILILRRGGASSPPAPDRRGLGPAPTAIPGITTALVLGLYGATRFCLDFLRVGDTVYYGLTPAQFGSVALVVIAIVLAWRAYGLRGDVSHENESV
ncbi:MAG: prolipoprotein diacylglyceryl transferase family protein [Candidatus Uhrbacteria bacterium]